MEKDKTGQRKSASQERSKITVNSIITATSELLKEYQISDLTTSKIIEKAGVSVGSMYQYFASKDSILTTIFQKQMNKDVDSFLNDLKILNHENLKLEDAIIALVNNLFDDFKIQSKIQKQLIFSIISLNHLKFTLDNDKRVNESIKSYLIKYQDEIRSDLDFDRSIFLFQYLMKGIKFGVMFANKEEWVDGLKKDISQIIYNFVKK